MGLDWMGMDWFRGWDRTGKAWRVMERKGTAFMEWNGMERNGWDRMG